jgi:hypothetical protein
MPRQSLEVWVFGLNGPVLKDVVVAPMDNRKVRSVNRSIQEVPSRPTVFHSGTRCHAQKGSQQMNFSPLDFTRLPSSVTSSKERRKIRYSCGGRSRPRSSICSSSCRKKLNHGLFESRVQDSLHHPLCKSALIPLGRFTAGVKQQFLPRFHQLIGQAVEGPGVAVVLDESAFFQTVLHRQGGRPVEGEDHDLIRIEPFVLNAQRGLGAQGSCLP